MHTLADAMTKQQREKPTLVPEFIESVEQVIKLVNCGEITLRVSKTKKCTVENIIKEARKTVVKLQEVEGVRAKMKFKAIPKAKYLEDNPGASVEDDGLILKMVKLPGYAAKVECVLFRQQPDGLEGGAFSIRRQNFHVCKRLMGL